MDTLLTSTTPHPCCPLQKDLPSTNTRRYPEDTFWVSGATFVINGASYTYVTILDGMPSTKTSRAHLEPKPEGATAVNWCTPPVSGTDDVGRRVVSWSSH